MQLRCSRPGDLGSYGSRFGRQPLATLTLPPGMTINPAVAAGLGACTPAELAAEEPDAEPGKGCPQSSKLGTAAVTTPLFSEAIKGAMYLARPEGAVGDRHRRLQIPPHPRSRLQRRRARCPARPAPQCRRRYRERPPHRLSRRNPQAADLQPGTAPQFRPPCAAHDPWDLRIALDRLLARASSGNPHRLAPGPSPPPRPNAARASPRISGRLGLDRRRAISAFVFELSQGAAAPDLSGVSLTLPPGLSASFAAVPPCPEGQVASGDCPVASKLGFARVALGLDPNRSGFPPAKNPIPPYTSPVHIRVPRTAF